MRLTFLIAGALVASSPVAAAEPMPLRIQCTATACLWAAITANATIGTNARGTLHRVDTETWTVRDGERTVRRPRRFGQDQSTAYVFCSTTVPAVIFRTGVEARIWLRYPLAPNEPRGIVDYNRGSTVIYFAVCHDRRIEPVDAAIVAAARELGYAADADAIAPTSIERPEAVLAE